MAERSRLEGRKFNRLTVLSFAGMDGRYSSFLCECQCGTRKIIRGTNLTHGGVVSCGCWKKERGKTQGEGQRRHGQCGSRTYKSWHSMKMRCNNPNSSGWELYGGRGVSICNRWLESFENFYADMGDRPENTSLDRINPNGNYEPSNCRWATPKQQSRNSRNTVKVQWKGEERLLVELCEELGIDVRRTYSRIHRGVPINEAVSTELFYGVSPHKNDHILEFHGEKKRIVDWARETGIKAVTLYSRIRAGWSIEDALTLPLGGRKKK